jgi:predicted RNA methylase
MRCMMLQEQASALTAQAAAGLKPVDTVLMNPPFGTRRAGADIEFLQLGVQLARRAVYSMHKVSQLQHCQLM